MLFDDTYKTVQGRSEGLYKEKGSRFIAVAFPVCSEDEVKERLAELRKEYHDARHHCYAYILGPSKDAYRINDDGEPSGTAGRPIHGQLMSKDLTNTLVVVIRYFGGIKLGVSGLINAYKTAAKDALDNASIIEKTVNDKFRIHFGFSDMNSVMQILKDSYVQILEQTFEMDYVITFTVRHREAERIVTAIKKITTVKIEPIY